MTPLQQMTKAAYEAEWGPGSWDLVSEDRQKERCRYMSAGLLAEFELEKTLFNAGWEDNQDTLYFEVDFKSLLRRIATENTDV